MCYGQRYFSMYYGIREFDRQARAARRIFQGQLPSYRANDDAAGYTWLVLRHTLHYAMATGNPSYLDNGSVRAPADLAAITTDNRGYECSYGDVGVFRARKAEVTSALFAAAAAGLHQDGRYAWLHDWLAREESAPSGDEPPRWALCDGHYFRHWSPGSPITWPASPWSCSASPHWPG